MQDITEIILASEKPIDLQEPTYTALSLWPHTLICGLACKRDIRNAYGDDTQVIPSTRNKDKRKKKWRSIAL